MRNKAVATREVKDSTPPSQSKSIDTVKVSKKTVKAMGNDKLPAHKYSDVAVFWDRYLYQRPLNLNFVYSVIKNVDRFCTL